MATSSNLSSIIRHYAEKAKTPFIDFKEFCVYIKKYAEKHIEEEGALVKYLGDHHKSAGVFVFLTVPAGSSGRVRDPACRRYIPY